MSGPQQESRRCFSQSAAVSRSRASTKPERREVPRRGVEHPGGRCAFTGNQPDEAIIHSFGAIAFRWRGGVIGMRMIAADDSTIRSAQAAKQSEMNLRINQEALRWIGGQILRSMQRRRAPAFGRYGAFDQAATLHGVRGPR